MSDGQSNGGWSGSSTRKAWLSWVGVAVICNAIWLVTWVTSSGDGVPYYWPIWVMVPWAAVIVAGVITGRRD